jgi:ribonuclease VapC
VLVVDTSALVAILLREPDAEALARCLIDAPRRLVSAVTRAELSFVIEGRNGEGGRLNLERLLNIVRIEVVSVTPQHTEIAIEAFRHFGRGRHAAALNIGDCFSYALAKATDLPLLFKGNDFVQTDIRPALNA